MLENVEHIKSLDGKDMEEYIKLKESLNYGNRNKRGKGLHTFEEQLASIRSFVERGGDNSWKRSLVCGICWIDNDIGINIQQFKTLLGKCKSSINSCLLKLGYSKSRDNGGVNKFIVEKIPSLRSDPELRRWTIRIRSKGKPQACAVSDKGNSSQLVSTPAPSICTDPGVNCPLEFNNFDLERGIHFDLGDQMDYNYAFDDLWL